MKHFEIIIIGGGASAILTALSCPADRGAVAIIDDNIFIGKKLLATGNGRCNLTNVKMNSAFFNQNIDNFLEKFNAQNAIEFFNNIGLVTTTDECGRVYPFSNNAKSVVDILQSKLIEKNISQFSSHKVTNITQNNGKFFITALAENSSQNFSCNKLVLATGGNTLRDIITNFGISYVPPTPSLCALKTAQNTKHLSGVRVSNVRIFLLDNNAKKLREEYGEILFKDHGISGIATMNISTFFARNHDFSGKFYVDFVPKMSEKSLIFTLFSRKILPGNLLIGFLHDLVAKEIYTRLKLNFNAPNSTLTDQNICDIAHQMKQLEFTVTAPYDNAQVHSGGVNLDELDDNLQSKKIRNLYFCGELINIDGESGGYNLQWAWTSGHIVGKNL